MPTGVRLVTLADATELADLLQVNREFLAPWEPVRDDAYFTAAGQAEAIGGALAAWTGGTRLPLLIIDDAGTIAGQIFINNIIRGAFLSAALGYWVRQDLNGKGLASRAVAAVIEIAFCRLGLHRLEASTTIGNTASQRVLIKNHFQAFGNAPAYLKIAGRWQDHRLYQRISSER